MQTRIGINWVSVAIQKLREPRSAWVISIWDHGAFVVWKIGCKTGMQHMHYVTVIWLFHLDTKSAIQCEWHASALRNIHIHCIWIKKQTYQIHNINQFKYDINHSISFKFNIILYQYKSFNIWILISNHSISFSNSGMLSSHSSDIETSQKRRALPSKGRLRKSVKIETGWDHGDPFKIHLSHI